LFEAANGRRYNGCRPVPTTGPEPWKYLQVQLWSKQPPMTNARKGPISWSFVVTNIRSPIYQISPLKFAALWQNSSNSQFPPDGTFSDWNQKLADLRSPGLGVPNGTHSSDPAGGPVCVATGSRQYAFKSVASLGNFGCVKIANEQYASA
jgi:hypothetical protein